MKSLRERIREMIERKSELKKKAQTPYAYGEGAAEIEKERGGVDPEVHAKTFLEWANYPRKGSDITQELINYFVDKKISMVNREPLIKELISMGYKVDREELRKRELLATKARKVLASVDSLYSVIFSSLLKEGVDLRYQEEDGRFKVMTCPDNPEKESRFCGCVRYMMAKRNLALENAKRLCAYIKRQKYGSKYFDSGCCD